MPPSTDQDDELEGLLSSLDTPLVAVDLELRASWVNDAAKEWLGRSERRLTGQPLAEALPWGPSLAALARRVLEGGHAVRDELRESTNCAEVEAVPWWKGGELRGAVLLARLARTFDAEGVHADVAALATGLAHEVRNPLAAVRGAAELLRMEVGADSVAAGEYAELILREVGRVDALVARMMTLARPAALRREAVAVAELVHELALSARAFARARGASVSVEERFDPALPPLMADRALVLEALLNLVKNAVEALPLSGGRVHIDARIDPQRRRRVGAGRSTSLLRLAVRDDGPGLGDGRERLFTPFFSTKPGGTGLGLLLARRSIEAHGGVLSLRDGPDGTEARALLPLEAFE